MRRAVDQEDRQARRDSILEAARNLFRKGDGKLPTAAEVASEAGLAKGTVYIYFKTKEEIFANVLLEGWLQVLASTKTMFGTKKRGRLHQSGVFIRATVRHLEEKSELLPLDTLGAGVLEKNMAPDALLGYKARFNKGLVDAGCQIDDALGLPDGRGLQLLMRTYALTRGLWQMSALAEECEATGPIMAAIASKTLFLQDLSEALHEYWRGALSS